MGAENFTKTESVTVTEARSPFSKDFARTERFVISDAGSLWYDGLEDTWKFPMFGEVRTNETYGVMWGEIR